MIHLDTSFLIRALLSSSRESDRLREWLTAGESLGISSIAWAEFLCGPLGAREIDLASQVVHDPVPFAAEDARRAAELFNSSGRRRGTLVDCMIAATALRAKVALASSNPRDFRPLEAFGLELG